MFDIGWSELLVLIIVALIFIGPKELPTALYFVGKVVGKIRDYIDSFYQQVADFKPNLSEEENEENYSSPSSSKRSSQKSDVRKKSPAKKHPSPKIKSTSGEKQKK